MFASLVVVDLTTLCLNPNSEHTVGVGISGFAALQYYQLPSAMQGGYRAMAVLHLHGTNCAGTGSWDRKASRRLKNLHTLLKMSSPP